MCNCYESLDTVHILGLHLCEWRVGSEECEAGQALHKGISLKLEGMIKKNMKCRFIIYKLKGNDISPLKFITHNPDFSASFTRHGRVFTVMWNIQVILMAHRRPSRQREATSASSQSCKPTENAARKGVHAICIRRQMNNAIGVGINDL